MARFNFSVSPSVASVFAGASAVGNSGEAIFYMQNKYSFDQIFDDLFSLTWEVFYKMNHEKKGAALHVTRYNHPFFCNDRKGGVYA